MIKGFSAYINEAYNNPKDFIDIKYGNPLKWQKESMDLGSPLLKIATENGMMEKWKSRIPPLQGSDIVKKSIEDLIMLGSSLNPDDENFIKEAEKDLIGMYLNFLKINGQTSITREDLEAITNQLDPITFELKYHFNYPRPLQLSLEHGLSLYPSQPTDACSPSYPSGHTIDSFVIGQLIAKKLPQLEDSVLELAEKISFSRNQGGIHFVFDSDYSKEIVSDILSLDFLSL